MKLLVGEIIEAVGGTCTSASANVTVCGVNWDSRAIQVGDMYVALPGERVDGHDFIEGAAAKGAVCALVSREVEAAIPLILADDTAAALTRLSAYWRGRLEGVVIGLTGSVGKTSTKNLVRDVLSFVGSVVATKANQNNELGVPNTLLAADADTQAVVVEMGMRGRGQITELCEIARPDWGIRQRSRRLRAFRIRPRQARRARRNRRVLQRLPRRRSIRLGRKRHLRRREQANVHAERSRCPSLRQRSRFWLGVARERFRNPEQCSLRGRAYARERFRRHHS